MTSSVLTFNDIFTGREPSKVVILDGQLDDLTCSPLPVWMALLKSRCTSSSVPCYLLNSAHTQLPRCISAHHTSSVVDIVVSSSMNNYWTTLDGLLSDDKPPCHLFLDDIDFFAWDQSMHKHSQLFFYLQKISNSSKILSVVILFNSAAHSAELKSSIIHTFSTTHLTVFNSNPVTPGNCLSLGVSLLHRKNNGKILCHCNSLKIRLNCQLDLVECQEVQDLDDGQFTLEEEHQEPGANEESAPRHQTTFNLHLSSSEQQARSQLKLPYTKSEGTRAYELTGGNIVYEPDEFDDLDEEDPDDDLDV